MAATRPTRTRPATRTYQDENITISNSHPAKSAKPDSHKSDGTLLNGTKNIAVASGVKRPALASKDQQPPRKVTKHTRSSSATSKPDAPTQVRRAPSVPLGTSTSHNAVRRNKAVEAVVVPTSETSVEENDQMKPSSSRESSGLTPSLTGLGVDAHPSSSRYIDTVEDESRQSRQAVIPEETEEEEQQLDSRPVPPFDVAEGVEEIDPEDWLTLPKDIEYEAQLELQEVRARFVDEIDELDCTMVTEYADEIFHLMGQLEERSLPNANYMEFQNEMDWQMRSTLIDWLLQVHLRYHMLPETLWIAVNIVDRFLSARVVSLIKLQLVGVTAMFIAAKYEEILAPSVEEFVFMTEGGYTKDEILKGERIILQTLSFDVSSYCSPYSWVRKISKADDYDVQTRTLSKYLMEVTLLDHRFLRAKPSVIAAIGMYLARRMLPHGDWSEAFVFYSGFTENQVIMGARILTEVIAAPGFETQYVFKKYATKKFLRASQFAGEWARGHVVDEVAIF